MLNNPWTQLLGKKETGNSLRAIVNHPLDFFWGIDQYGDYLFYCENIMIPQELSLSKITGIRLATFPESNPSQLIFGIKQQEDWEFFLTLCNDIINSTYKSSNQVAIYIILRRLQKWQDFLGKEYHKNLSESQIEGLIGELIFIEKSLKPVFGLTCFIRYWTGPTGTAQDFSIRNTAIEVKTQLSVTNQVIKISSAEQLTSQVDHLYLHVITLGRSNLTNSNAITLPIIIKRISEELITSPKEYEYFVDMLLDIGYIYSSYYDTFVYDFVSSQTYKVKEDFPCITTANLKCGVSRVSYQISLVKCAPFACNLNWNLKEIL